MERHELLIESFFNDELNDGQANELETWLLADECNRSLFVLRSFEHRVMRDALEGQANQVLINLSDHVNRSDGRPQRWRTAARIFARPTPVSMTAAALVIGLLITAMALVAPPFYRAAVQNELAPPESRQFVARLTGLYEAVWAEGQVAAHQGAVLRHGHQIRLKEGLAELDYHCGARVILEGPCEFVVTGRGTGRLQSGKVAAQVNKEAAGFSIVTPVAQIVDLGTEFGVQVAEDGLTEIHVFSGEIEWSRRNAAGPVGNARRLTQGQAVQLDAQGRQAVNLAVSDKRFTRPSEVALGPSPRLRKLISIVNPSFEDGAAPLAGATGWSIAVGAGANEFYTTAGADRPSADPAYGQEGPGSQFLTANRLAMGEEINPSSSLATQSVDLTVFAADIDTGKVLLDLDFFYNSGDVRDRGFVSIEFVDAGNGSLGSLSTGALPETADEVWVAAKLAGAVPLDTRMLKLQLNATRDAGSATNVSFDNVRAVLVIPYQGGALKRL